MEGPALFPSVVGCGLAAPRPTNVARRARNRHEPNAAGAGVVTGVPAFFLKLKF